MIVAHLGSGASMCALSSGRSVESTMGFTALDGLPMGTRPGQLDPGVVLYLHGREGHDRRRRCRTSSIATAASRAFPASATTCASCEPAPIRAPHSRSTISSIGSGSSRHAGGRLGGLDAFVFTAGIGENSASIRARIAERLAWLGVVLDPAANASRGQRDPRPDSRVAVYVIPTDEELMIARHTLARCQPAGQSYPETGSSRARRASELWSEPSITGLPREPRSAGRGPAR